MLLASLRYPIFVQQSRFQMLFFLFPSWRLLKAADNV
jgi:hypothetical protein